jgi:tetratricopeptide (TPR) repeat protein
LTCRPDRILRYAFGEPSEDEHAETQLHVASCVDCRDDLEAVHRIAVGATWRDDSPEPPSSPSPDLIENVRAVAVRDAEERAVAATTAEWLVAMPADLRRRAVINRSSVTTPALAWAVMDAANSRLYSEPKVALGLFDVAAFIADGVSARGAMHSHELRVEAWKNYAWTLAYFGEYARAEEALDWAEDAADQCADRRHMLAIVQFARGIFLSQMERWTEALVLVIACRKTFRSLGDEVRSAKALEQEANIRMRTGDAAGAVAILSSLIDVAADDATRARRFSNIAKALEIAGVLWLAGEYVAKAQAINERLGATMNLHNNSWTLGRILAKADRIDEAVLTLDRASRGFRSLDAVDDAIRVDLDRSEIELDHRVTTDATYERLRVAAAYAVEKGLPVSKCRALEYLQHLGRAVKIEHIRFVRDFYDHVSSNPHVHFSPPEQIS